MKFPFAEVKTSCYFVTSMFWISILVNVSSQPVKVLRLWLERKILPESIIRHHIRELDSYSASASTGAFSRRSLRTERALDDPVREMEGMLVDEYGRFEFVYDVRLHYSLMYSRECFYINYILILQ